MTSPSHGEGQEFESPRIHLTTFLNTAAIFRTLFFSVQFYRMSTIRRAVLTAAYILAGFFAGFFVDNLFLSKTPISEWAKALNTDYANLLTFAATALLVLVTIIYAGYTYRQVTYSRKQFLLDKQPYVIPTITSRNFSDFEESETEYTRTLRLEYKFANVGTETAFSVQPFVSISYPDTEGTMHTLKNFGLVPLASAYLTAGEEKNASLSLYEKGSDENNEGLELVYPSFGYRLLENGDIVPDTERKIQTSFPVLTLKVYYRNLVGQWFVSVIKEDITAIVRLADNSTGTYPKVVKKYRLEAAQTIQYIPLEIREANYEDVKKEFALHGKSAEYLQTENI